MAGGNGQPGRDIGRSTERTAYFPGRLVKQQAGEPVPEDVVTFQPKVNAEDLELQFFQQSNLTGPRTNGIYYNILDLDFYLHLDYADLSEKKTNKCRQAIIGRIRINMNFCVSLLRLCSRVE